jgi:hypothetical protein
LAARGPPDPKLTLPEPLPWRARPKAGRGQRPLSRFSGRSSESFPPSRRLSRSNPPRRCRRFGGPSIAHRPSPRLDAYIIISPRLIEPSTTRLGSGLDPIRPLSRPLTAFPQVAKNWPAFCFLPCSAGSSPKVGLSPAWRTYDRRSQQKPFQ